MSLRFSRGEAEGESETRELCRAPNPRTRYSLSNLYHPGARCFERLATRGNIKCGLCLYLIHTFGPIACIKSDIRWYKYTCNPLTRLRVVYKNHIPLLLRHDTPLLVALLSWLDRLTVHWCLSTRSRGQGGRFNFYNILKIVLQKMH